MLPLVHVFNTFFSIAPQLANFRYRNILFAFRYSLLFGFEHTLEKLANLIPLLLFIFFTLLLVKLVIFIEGVQQMLVLFLLSHPKKMFIEFVEDLKNCSSPFVVFVVVSHLNGSIDSPHYKLYVVPFLLPQVQPLYLLPILISFLLESKKFLKIASLLKSTREKEVVFYVVLPVHFSDDLSHPGGATRCGSLGVAISQIDQNIVEDVLNSDYEGFLDLVEFHMFFQQFVVFNGCDGLPEYGVEVEHYIFGCVFLCLLLFKIPLAHEFEGNRNHIAGGLNQKYFDSVHDLLA